MTKPAEPINPSRLHRQEPPPWLLPKPHPQGLFSASNRRTHALAHGVHAPPRAIELAGRSSASPAASPLDYRRRQREGRRLSCRPSISCILIFADSCSSWRRTSSPKVSTRWLFVICRRLDLLSEHVHAMAEANTMPAAG
jgi:hypothetical protein